MKEKLACNWIYSVLEETERKRERREGAREREREERKRERNRLGSLI